MNRSVAPDLQGQLDAAHSRIRELELALARQVATSSPSLEEALQRSEVRAQAMLAAVPDQFFRMDRHGIFLDYKADERDLYYQGSAPMIGQSCHAVLPLELAEIIEQSIAATLQTRILQMHEYQLSRPGERPRYFEARVVPSGPDEVLSMVREVTDRRQAD